MNGGQGKSAGNTTVGKTSSLPLSGHKKFYGSKCVSTSRGIHQLDLSTPTTD